jgi:CheY-like chemotaxis protein
MAAPSPRILLVDDEPDFLTIGRALLRNTCGCEVETATSAKKALDLLKSSQFDAVISDYIMPEMNGIELLKAVRNDDVTRNIPFILLTGQGEEKIAVDAINNGVDFYLPKGGDPTSRFTDICHKVQWAIDRNQERNRREEQQRAKGKITHSSVAICSFHQDYKGNLIFDGSNSETENIFKIDAKTMAGKPIQEVFPGLDATPILEKLKGIAEIETTWDFEDIAILIGE